tara:strand:- start:3 stop:194 length:192 start_codon:yes stop_codon:yes gene_type:complete
MEEKKVKKTMAKKVVHKKKPENSDLKDLQNIVIGMHSKISDMEDNISNNKYGLDRVLKRLGLM